MDRLPYAKFALWTLVLTVITSLIMVPIRWNGEAASEERADIDTLLDVMIVLSSFVFWLVMILLGYSLWKFRAKPGDESDGEPIHGNTRLEIAWTLIPTIIVLFGAGYSWIVLDKIEAREPDNIAVDVYSQQFAWNFTYPEDNKFSRGELHVPVDHEIVFSLHALDVLHSFWVPEWGIKKDNVPGITTQAIVTPNKEGTYQLVCTELCGFGHTTMRAEVIVESEEEYEEWLRGLDEPPVEYTGEPHEQGTEAEETAGA